VRGCALEQRRDFASADAQVEQLVLAHRRELQCMAVRTAACRPAHEEAGQYLSEQLNQGHLHLQFHRACLCHGADGAVPRAIVEVEISEANNQHS
jgi:hypothetical protein